jgi:hypothetical protein
MVFEIVKDFGLLMVGSWLGMFVMGLLAMAKEADGAPR